MFCANIIWNKKIFKTEYNIIKQQTQYKCENQKHITRITEKTNKNVESEVYKINYKQNEVHKRNKMTTQNRNKRI